MIWKDQPVEKEIEDINSKIGTVPSGKTVEGQITELNSNLNEKILIETESIPEFAIPANAATSLNLEHIKTGYTCYFLYYVEYRTGATWFTHVKSAGANVAVIDVANLSSTPLTPTTAKAVWLCVKNS